MEEKKDLVKVISSLEGKDSKELIKALIKGAIQKESQRNTYSPSETIKKLSEIKDDLDKKYDFKANDIVKWKANLKNRSMPDYGEPAIVLELLDEPVFDERETGSTYFREPLDMILGILAEGELVSFHYDSRKFQPFGEVEDDVAEIIEEDKEE